MKTSAVVSLKIYLDSDLILALVKEEDWLKEKAIKFLEQAKKRGHELFTSSVACLEVWFHFNKAGLNDKASAVLSAIAREASVLPIGFDDLLKSAQVSRDFGLSPADSIHAVIALRFDAIASSDKHFDKIKALKRIDYTK